MLKISLAVAITAVLSLPIPVARAQTSTATPASEIHTIFLADQSDRQSPTGEGDWSKIGPRDAARKARVRKMLETGELKTGQDYREASFIFQHGEVTDDYLLAHILATVALAKGDMESRWISAATLDRYLQKLGQPQVFGTQYSQKAKTDPETQEPFDRKLVPGDLRAELCVPNDKIQLLMLEAFQHGRWPDLSKVESELPCRKKEP